jgi:ribosomal-protein-alanine N-acetyltransferase
MLHPSHWRKGIMKEALDILVPFAFNEIKLHSIEAHINPGNIASANILTSAGFIREAYFKEDYFLRESSSILLSIQGCNNDIQKF